MNRINLSIEQLMQFIRDYPHTRIYAVPERYCKTENPTLILSHELFQKLYEQLEKEQE